MLERHGHGGDVWTAAELYGIDKNAFLDFSSNMNPLGPHPAAERIIREEWRRELSRYPDPDCRELRAAVSRVYGVPESCILAGNGAAELIDLAVRAFMPRTVGLLRPCFGEYAKAAERSGAVILDLPLDPKTDFDADRLTQETWDRALEAEVLFVGHPNNPTGRLLPESFVNRLLDRGKQVIVDEAFLDFSAEEDRLTWLRQAAERDNLLVIRSLTKFYTMPGLRLGFAVGTPRTIARMKALQVEWSVNALAQRVGAAVLGDRDFAKATLDWVSEERTWLTDQLRELGLQVLPSAANYLLFRLPEGARSIRELQSALGKRGILIRDASAFGWLDDRYGRIAVRLREDNWRLAAALEAALHELIQGGKA